MLKREQQELLTQTGPGTSMGELFRRYWVPALLAKELPEPDCPPVRVRLLGENLVAFRDTKGKLGLIDEFCAHRGVSLYFGRNEECGLRCPYHGWKYDVDGNCVEVPSEPEDSNFRKKMKLKSYPCVERGGVIWTYMGPLEFKPALPELEWVMVPQTHHFISKRLQECNYLQAMEGGLLIGARRNAQEGSYYWRITQWIMPWYTVIPPRGNHPIGAHAWVPIDDEHCWAWSVNYHPARPLTEKELQAMRNGEGIHVKYVPGTFRPLANKDNDYLIDRAAQKAGKTYSGVEGIAMQDASLQESAGPIQDRSRENLVSSDNGIIMARQCLMKAALDLKKGVAPPALDPATHKVRSASVVLPKEQQFQVAAKEALIAKPNTPPASI